MKRKDKVYIISLVLLDNNTIQLTYLLQNILKNDNYRGYFIKTCLLNDIDLFKKIKIGKWKKVDLDYVGNIVYLYH